MKFSQPMIFVLVLATGVLSFTAAAHAQTAIKTNLNCECVLETSLCNFARFDEAAGKPRKSWRQDFFYPQGTTPTAQAITLACWRKRDANAGGEGLCCSLDRDERDAERYFKGVLR